jgi:hypothetical protein
MQLISATKSDWALMVEEEDNECDPGFEEVILGRSGGQWHTMCRMFC